VAQDNNQGTGPEQQSTGLLNDPYTRRRFLRAAVVGTAGVAGAAGVAGVALGRSGGNAPSVLSHIFPALTGPSAPPSATAGFEDTGLGGNCITNFGKNGKGQVEDYFIFVATNVAPGSYTFDVTQQNSGSITGTGEVQPNGTGNANLPWETVNGQPVHVDVEPASSVANACPDDGGSVPSGTNVFPFSGLPATIPSADIPTESDLVIYVHLIYDGTPQSGDQTILTGTLKGPSPSSATLTASVTLTD
jgi:hypothetical protein